MAKGKKLLEGFAAGAPGIVVCKVHIINGDEAKLAKVTADECIVADKLEPQPKTGMSFAEYDSHLHRAKAFIQNTGGFSNHANIVARETGKPSISGTVGISDVEATTVLQEGQKIVVEGYTGYAPRQKLLIDPLTKKPEMTTYYVKVGSVYEWVPGPDDEEVSPAPPVKTPPKPTVGSFNMADFLKQHGQRPKGG